jgi:hypothetical protein
MTTPDTGTPRHVALWTGRRGVVNTVACCALALPCAMALVWLTERTTAAPACGSYGQAHGLTFVGVVHYSRDDSSTVCQFTQGSGESSEVPFRQLAPGLTDLWVSFALDAKFTVGAFAVFLAFVRTVLFQLQGARL